MSDLVTPLLIPFLASMFLAINMGGSGTAPSFAVAYGAQLIRKDRIPGIFGIFVFLGAIIAGKKVALTIGRDILPAEIMTPELTTLVLLAIGLAMLFANLLKVPQSTTQTTVFALVGPAIYFDILQTRRLFGELIPLWFILPIASFVITYLVGRFIYHPSRQRWPRMTGRANHFPLVGWVVILASCYVAFAIGSNNVANAAGPIVSMVVNELGIQPSSREFVLILILATLVVAPCFAIGSSIFGGDMVEKIGNDLLELGPGKAIIISLVTATLLISASVTRGIPTSLVQMNVGAIIGMGLSEHGWRRIREDTPLLKIVRVWFAAPLLALGLSWLLTAAVDRSGLLQVVPG